MAKVDVVNLKNEKVGSVDLSDAVFSVKVNQPLVLQVIKAHLAGLRQGTASTKTKGLIRGGGKKPFKQKGTGNARQGSSRSPLNPGGGSTFGPLPRKYHQDTPKEMVRGALRCVLSDKLASKHLLVVDSLELSSAKTKDFAKILAQGFKAEKALLVDAKSNAKLQLASRNLPNAGYCSPEAINAYDMVKHDWLILSKEAAVAISARLG
jgi:large subunit ribosomal protein L4